MTIEKPAYWAVLPAGVRYDETLPASAKLLYAEISSLTNQEGYCYASNAYFMALYGISDATVRTPSAGRPSGGSTRGSIPRQPPRLTPRQK